MGRHTSLRTRVSSASSTITVSSVDAAMKSCVGYCSGNVPHSPDAHITGVSSEQATCFRQ